MRVRAPGNSFNYRLEGGSKVIEVFQDFKEYRVGVRYSCAWQCKNSQFIFKANKQYGESYQEAEARYCRECEVHFKKEVGLHCPCCKRKLRVRIRTKQGRKVRERIAFERQLSRSVEEQEVQRAISNTYYWYKCRSQCDFKTDNLLEARQHKEQGHGIKRIPIPIASILGS